MKLEFSKQTFEKVSSIRFYKIRPLTAEFFMLTDGHTETDGHDEANSRFSQFCEVA
jgi:hypothetical protein